MGMGDDTGARQRANRTTVLMTVHLLRFFSPRCMLACKRDILSPEDLNHSAAGTAGLLFSPLPMHPKAASLVLEAQHFCL